MIAQAAAATSRLADPTDLPFPDDLLDDDGLVEDKIRVAVDDLVGASHTSRPAEPLPTSGRARDRKRPRAA